MIIALAVIVFQGLPGPLGDGGLPGFRGRDGFAGIPGEDGSSGRPGPEGLDGFKGMEQCHQYILDCRVTKFVETHISVKYFARLGFWVV